jgi:ribosomal protection tetracycline resistance protein
MRTLNLGILAHVDAGKTTLTERLLFSAGVIDEIGTVDTGSTHTDTLALERARGITIRSAVVSFRLDDVTVNLIDTPGHPDFIAEVERVLHVLDGVVLVVSAVEGVQAQTLVLMRTLQRLRIPTLLFVNKVDRRGANVDAVLEGVRARLTPAIVPMVAVRQVGTRAASIATPDDVVAHLTEAVAEHDDAFFASFVEDEPGVGDVELRRRLAVLTRDALVHPVFVGSAATGAGVDVLMEALTAYLPVGDADPNGSVEASVFKIERGPSGEKIAYVRMFRGSIATRDAVVSSSGSTNKVTGLEVFDGGLPTTAPVVRAGQIGKLFGLSDVRVGEAVGSAAAVPTSQVFDPPALEAVVAAREPDQGGALRRALIQLAEQDPLINLRQRAGTSGIYVSLYGEVQQEVLEATLADDYGIDVVFRGVRVLCVERPAGPGAAVLRISDADNDRPATVGLRIEPAAAGSGVRFKLDVDLASVPLYIYGTVQAFGEAIERAVDDALAEGPHGWRVTDCVVTMTDAGYRSPSTTAGDFKHLTGTMVRRVLDHAGTVVCEPIHTFQVEVPADSLPGVWQALARLGATPDSLDVDGAAARMGGQLAASLLPGFRRQLAGLTHGEGVVSSSFSHYHPVAKATNGVAR